MGFTCCTPGCKTNYRSVAKEESVSVFKFPKDEKLRNKWIRAIPRKDWIPNEKTRICAKHFHPSDLQTESTDGCRSRKDSRASQTLRRIRLKPDAIPQVFPNLPALLSATANTKIAEMDERLLGEQNSLEMNVQQTADLANVSTQDSETDEMKIVVAGVHTLHESSPGEEEFTRFSEESLKDETARSIDFQEERLFFPQETNRILPSRAIKRSFDIKTPQGLMKKRIPSKNKCGLDVAISRLHNIAENNKVPESEDQYAQFGKHIASQLRELPLRNFVIMQEKIQSLITQERLSIMNDATHSSSSLLCFPNYHSLNEHTSSVS